MDSGKEMDKLPHGEHLLRTEQQPRQQDVLGEVMKGPYRLASNLLRPATNAMRYRKIETLLVISAEPHYTVVRVNEPIFNGYSH